MSLTRLPRVHAGVIVALLAIAFVAIPLLYGYLQANGRYFTGADSNPADYAVYLSYVQQGYEGRVLTTNLYTTVPQKAVFLHPTYVLVGHLARIAHVSTLTAFVVARFVAIAACVAALCAFVRVVVRDAHRTTALFFVCFSAGLGFLPMFGGSDLDDPMDAWLGESTTLSTMSAEPHFALALAAKVLALTLWFRAAEERRWRFAALAGALCAWLAFDHPFEVVTNAIAIAAYVTFDVIAKRSIRVASLWPSLVTAAVCAPGLFFAVFQLRGSSYHVQRMRIGVEPLPSVASFALGLGLTGVLAVVGVIHSRRSATELSSDRARRFVVVWAVTNALAMFAFRDTWFGRRLVLGAHVAIAVLAAVGAVALVAKIPNISPRIRGGVLAVVILILAITHLDGFAHSLSVYTRGRSGNDRVYLEAEEREVLALVAAHTPVNAVVQALPWLERSGANELEVGDATLLLFLPALTGRRETCGHLIETPQYHAKLLSLGKLTWRLANDNDPAPVWRAMGADYLVYSQAGRGGVAATLDPRLAGELPTVAATPHIKVLAPPR